MTDKIIVDFVKAFGTSLAAAREAIGDGGFYAGELERSIAVARKDVLDSVIGALNASLLEFKSFDVLVEAEVEAYSVAKHAVETSKRLINLHIVPCEAEGSRQFIVHYNNQQLGVVNIDEDTGPIKFATFAVRGLRGLTFKAAIDAIKLHLCEPAPLPRSEVPKLSDPCTRDGGRHELYQNAGPGGKRHHVKGWVCCQSCGANGSEESLRAGAKALPRKGDTETTVTNWKVKPAAKKPAAKKKK